MKKYSLCKFAGYYICEIRIKDYLSRIFLNNLEEEMFDLVGNKTVDICFSILISNSYDYGMAVLTTKFEDGKINYKEINEGDLL